MSRNQAKLQPHRKVTQITEQFQLVCTAEGSVTRLPGLKSNSDIKPNKCFFTVHTVYITVTDSDKNLMTIHSQLQGTKRFIKATERTGGTRKAIYTNDQ